jgi:plasmid stabilization system protein ParE
LRDLNSIRRRLTREVSAETADHVEDALFKGFEELARLPWIGHKRDDVRLASLRFYNVFKYAIVFHREPRIVIVRVIHGARNIQRLF